MLRSIVAVAALVSASASEAKNLFATMDEQPSKVWQAAKSADLKFCVVTAIASRTGQASTVVEKGADTLVIVHNWSSPVPGDDVRGIFTIKPDAQIEFRGQKVDLVKEVGRCNSL